MGLLNFLKESENARKIFGKRELKIIEKQLMGVNLTQSEKNRLSRDIRKKFEFISNASRFEDEFELKKGSKIEKIIKEAKEVTLNDILFKQIAEIVLYGSAVKNNLTLKSDIDIAVKFTKMSLKKATLFRKRISGKVNKKVDIQVYNHLPEKIKNQIDSEGRVIYKK